MTAARGRKRATTGRTRATRGVGPKLEPEAMEKLLQAVRSGVPLNVAAEYVGVPQSTFFDWIRIGRRADAGKAYRAFVEQIDLALAEFEARQIARINKAGDQEWTASAWLLERKFPERYGRRTRVDSNVTVTAQPMIDPSKGTVQELEQLLVLLRKFSPAQEELTDGQRPALELVAAQLPAAAAADVIDGEAEEVPE